jgi:hypothetical protein
MLTVVSVIPSHEPERDPTRVVAPLRSNETVPPEDKDANLALDVLRGLADQELTRAERSATRARQVFALAAGFFAVVSTVAFTSFAKTLISGHERHVMLWLAALAGIFLATCGIALLVADRAFRSSHLTADHVLDTLNQRPDEPATYRYVELYARVVDEMRAANVRRGNAVIATQILGLLTIGAVLAELIYALYSRLS